MYKWIEAEAWKWIVDQKYIVGFGLVCQLLAEPAQILSYNILLVYNSLSAAIHLYMILILGL